MKFQPESDGQWRSKLARMKKQAQQKAKKLGLEEGFRSGFELQVAILLKHMGVPYEFESEKLEWTPRPIKHNYTPDFKVKTKSGKTIYIETKGRFMPEDMEKHLAVKEQHPDKDIRIVFSNPYTWYRAAKTRTYAKWANANGIVWCGKTHLKKFLPMWLAE